MGVTGLLISGSVVAIVDMRLARRSRVARRRVGLALLIARIEAAAILPEMVLMSRKGARLIVRVLRRSVGALIVAIVVVPIVVGTLLIVVATVAITV